MNTSKVGRGCGVGLDQTSHLEAKIGSGNGKETFRWYIYNLGHFFDFFQMRSCYCTSLRMYFSTLVPVLTIYVSLYGHLYLFLNGHEKQVGRQTNILHNMILKAAPATQSLIQVGMLMTFPMELEVEFTQRKGEILV